MCFAIFMLAFVALLLATQGWVEFFQSLAQSGPIRVALHGVRGWGHLACDRVSPVLPPSRGLDGVLETTSVTPIRVEADQRKGRSHPL